MPSRLISECTRSRRSRALGSLLAFAVLLGILAMSKPVAAQTRDNLTDEESELVRYYQELDKRIEIFIKAIDRRFAIINGTTPATYKKLVKDEPDWGAPPKGTSAELLGDIAGILDEAITNIDDVSHRDEKSPLLSRSLRKLTAATNGYITQLAALKSKLTTPDEIAALDRVADNAQQILDVGNKLPPPDPEEGKKKKKP